MTLWRRANPERARAKKKSEYYKNHEHNKELRRRQRIKSVYGITWQQWQEMFEAQGRVCACCGSDTPGNNRNWHTDHCRRTKVVRGILCSGCNQGLGNVRESITQLRSMIAYLEKHNVTAG